MTASKRLAAPIDDYQRTHPGSLARLAASPAQVLNARIGTPRVFARSPCPDGSLPENPARRDESG
jgi:hypothetical protein